MTDKPAESAVERWEAKEEWCRADVPDDDPYFGCHPCTRRATANGYCWQHQPKEQDHERREH